MTDTLQTDGQLYSVLHKGEREFPVCPPPGGPVSAPREQSGCGKSGLLSGAHKDELLILGLIVLLLSDRDNTDMPLVLALAYILLA